MVNIEHCACDQKWQTEKNVFTNNMIYHFIAEEEEKHHCAVCKQW